MAPHTLPGSAQREESDNYGAVAVVLNPKLRVIRSHCDLQWIVQKQNNKRNGAPIWTSFAFCATRTGLLLRIRDHLQRRDAATIIPLAQLVSLYCDPEAWAIIRVLPEFYPKQTPL